MCYHVPPLPTPLWFNPLPYPLDFLFLSLFSPIKSNLCYPYTLGNMAFHWHSVELPRTTLFKENQLFHTQLSIANSPSAWGRISCLTFVLHAEILCVFIFSGLAHAVTTAVSSYVHVQLPCCVQKILLPFSHLLTLTLTIFLSPLPK